jgi:hypothetical protein
MGDFSTERLDPASRVPEVPAQQPRRDPGSRSRRRTPAPDSPPAEAAEDSDAPPHQVDSLA